MKHNRIKFIVLAILVMFMAGCCIQLRDQNIAVQVDNRILVDNMIESTVALVTDVKPGDEFTKRPFCSGVWISKNEILTAGHCVEDELPDGITALDLGITMTPIGKKINYVTHSDVSIKGKAMVISVKHAVVIAFDHGLDLAVLSTIDEVGYHPFGIISSSSNVVGDRVHVVGHTLGFWWTYSSGFIASERELIGPQDQIELLYQISAPVSFGNSGGGAWDINGRLIGIASFISVKGPSMSFFVHKNVIREFLETNGIVTGK